MRREKYVYNRNSLRYEKVVEPLSYTILRIFGFACAAAFTALVMTMVTHRYFPSPAEKLLQAENEQLQSQMKLLGNEIDKQESVLANLRDRDAFAHRMIFGQKPIDDAVWEGGKGGHDKYEDLRAYTNSGDLMAGLREKVDLIRHQMDLQSRSLDTVIQLAEEKEEMLASIPSIKPVRSDKLSKGMNLLSGFGYRIHPIFKTRKMHEGIDFTAPHGTPIQATGAGKVIQAGNKGDGYGNAVMIDHGFGYRSFYAHMSSIKVKVGDKVKRGEALGKIGSTGQSTGAHLHYEMMKDGVKVDPIQYCHDGLSTKEYLELVQAAQNANQSFD